MPGPQQDAGAPADHAGVIPAQFRGEWGMNAADCEGGAAAKGLLEIGEDTLTFYESVGTLGDSASVGADSVQGLFAFEGEGMEWTREMRLEMRDGGDVLVRRELGEDAMPGAFEYRRCTREGHDHEARGDDAHPCGHSRWLGCTAGGGAGRSRSGAEPTPPAMPTRAGSDRPDRDRSAGRRAPGGDRRKDPALGSAAQRDDDGLPARSADRIL